MVLSVLRKCASCLFLVLPLVAAGQTSDVDLDRDGIPDQLEQAILEKFRPTFMISPLDCDRQPAEFLTGIKEAIVVDRNGTIYGQVFRPSVGASGTAVMELHYYHLWGKDCGKMGHALDAEYVASLVTAEKSTDPPEKWKAVYWYAAAHEGTVCDTSSIARATAIGAQDGGATVWISAGKHGSYLNRESCERGCGADRCLNSVALEPGRLINVGEIGTPLNGAEWTASTRWNLRQKMQTAFSADAVASADKAASEPALARLSNPRIQATIAAAGTSLDAASLGPQHTSAAVATAKTKTRNAISLSFSKVRNSLLKAQQSVAQSVDGH